VQRHADGGERRIEKAGEGSVVEADDRDVVRDPQAGATGRRHRADRGAHVCDEHRRRSGPEPQQPVGGHVAPCLVERRLAHELRATFHVRTCERLLVAAQPSARRIGILRACDVTDDAVSEREQVGGGERPAGLVVDGHARDAAGLPPVDEQGREAPPELAEARRLGRGHADEQAVNPPVEREHALG
jgi:hypothetical protein